MKQAISALKNLIKDKVSISKEIRRQIHLSKGDKKHALWTKKRAQGEETRYFLLAYGYLRGMEYHRIEQKTNSAPFIKPILDRIWLFLPQEGTEKDLWTKERVRAWLEHENSSEMQVKLTEVAA